MSTLTSDVLFRYLSEAAGATAPDTSASESLEVTFERLGYDSLVLLEAAARIQDEYGVDVGDDVHSVTTPRELLELVAERSRADTVPAPVAE